MANIIILILIFAFYILFKVLENWEGIKGQKERKQREAQYKKEREQRKVQEKREREQRERERIAQQKRREKLYNLVMQIGKESGITHLRRIVAGFDFRMRDNGLTPKQEELRNTADRAVREMEQQETEPNYSILPPPIPQQMSKPFDYQAPWWREYSAWYRNEKGWTCEKCELDLNYDYYYLHTHHKLGTQFNEPENLEALCLGCHVEEPGDSHAQLKTDPDYKKFTNSEYGEQRKKTLNSFKELALQFEKNIDALEHAHTHINQSYAKKQLGQYDLAIRLRPNDATAYYNRGLAKRKLGQYTAAIMDYDAAIRLKPDFVEANIQRGITKSILRQFKGAIVDFDTTIRLRPNDATAYHNRGWAKAMLHQTREAKQDLHIALKLATEAGDIQHKKQIESKFDQLK